MEGFFIAHISLFAGNFAPLGWALCNGQLLSIDNYTAVYALIGTTYGGDGQFTFGLPDFRGRIPVGTGTGPGLSNMVLGQVAGSSSHTLLTTQIPSHTHTATAAVPATGTSGNSNNPNGKIPAVAASAFYTPPTFVDGALGAVSGTVQPAGSSVPVNLGMPGLAFNFVICLEGIFPSRN